MVVVWLQGGESEIPFPPPKSSSIRTTIDGLKQERPVAPKILMAKAGSPQELQFMQLLIEEGSSETGQSYPQFINSITEQVEAMRAPGTA